MKRVCLGLIPSSLCLVGSLSIPFKTFAQVTSDGTLSTTVTSPDGSNFSIDGGNRPNGGGNLFHSFQDFSVPTNGSAVFNNANDVANIISRVTGGNFSSIDGLIKANGSANLFLLNPAGILFGENARLDIGGSFFGSTADSLLFPEGEFSAVDTQATPLLTVNIPIGLRFRDNPQRILNVSVANDVGLQVNPGETLGLIGGEVVLGFPGLPFSGKIISPGSNVELGGLTAKGVVTIDNDFKLGFPEGVERASISFFNAAEIDVASDGSGAITINAGDITLIEESKLLGGIAEGLGNANSQAGNINLNATGAVTLTSESSIQNTVARNAVGNSGDINVKGNSVTITSGSGFSASTFGAGNGGNINLDVKEAVNISGFSQQNSENKPIFSAVVSRLNSGSEGSTGDIKIKARSLSLENGGFLSGSTFGKGSAGDINIDIEESVTINSTGGIFSNVGTEAIAPLEERSTVTIRAGSLSIADNNSVITTSTVGIGNAGDIDIVVGSLSLKEGSFLSSDASGTGNAGNIIILSDETISLANGSFIGSNVSSNTISQGGQINLTAKSVSLSETSFISTSTFSGNKQSNAGNIEVNVTDSLNLTGDSFLSSGTGGQGDAGNITINGEGATILIQGGENLNSQIFSSNEATGNAGNIKITGRSLALENGGFLRSNSLGEGNAGNIIIDVEETISLADDSFVTSIISEEAVGQGGQINLTAKSVSLSGISSIATRTSSEDEQSDGGNIEINISESLNLTGGSFINSTTSGKGDAGNVTINGEGAAIIFQGTGNIGNGSSINNSSNSSGNAGNINIKGRSLGLEDGGSLNSSTFGQGLPGNITINVEEALALVNNGGIASLANKDTIIPEGENSIIQINAGDVVIDVDEDFKVVGGFILSNLSTGAKGKAGDINIQARSLSLENGAFFDSGSSGQGDSGIISISTDEAVTLSGAGTNLSNIVRAGGVGNSQGIFIKAESLTVNEGAQIQTLVRGASEDNAAGVGNAGDININTNNSVNIVGGSIRSSLGIDAKGKAGDVNIKARSLSLDNGAILNSSTFGQGDSGLVLISTDEAVRLSGAGTTIFNNVEAGGLGNSQGISIESESLTVNEGAQIQTLVRVASADNSAGLGNAGDVNINVRDTVDFSGVGVQSEGRTLTSQVTSVLQSGAEGKAGDIDIKARSLFLENGARLNNGSFGIGDAGNINLDIQDTVNILGFALNSDKTGILSSQISSVLGTGAEGKAGDINITARSLSLENRGQINNTTFGIGNAGNITLNIDDSINLFKSSVISNRVGQGGEGKGGDLDIQAKSLTLTEGSQISAAVVRAGVNAPGGKGIGGDLRITTTDFVDISGVSSVQLDILDTSNDPANTTGLIPTAGFSSGLFAATRRGATGDGGSITVTTDVFRIADGAVIDNSTTNDSNAGDITINANSFEATGGGQIITATRGKGNAADIKLNINDSMLISGSDPTFKARLASANEFGSIQGGDNIVTNQGAASGIFANTSADSTGRGGNIEIGIFKPEGENLVLDTNQFTPKITLANGARIAADSQGEGSGGAIFVQAQDFTLNNQAEILAETTAKQDNDTALSEINLGVANILQLRNDSQISTQALSNADGGNINIDTKFIIAFPGQKEGSDILTRAAETGSGGNINITAEALFGIEERKATTGNGTNDIDASSEFGLSGQITITRPEVNPTSGLLALTEEVVDPAKLIAQNVCTQTANSEFVDIGKGGLPQNPQYVLAEDKIEIGLVAPISTSGVEIESKRERADVKPKKTRKPPAQGWIWHENGIVELVAYNPEKVGEQRTWNSQSNCQ